MARGFSDQGALTSPDPAGAPTPADSTGSTPIPDDTGDQRMARAALWVFVGFVVVAFPLVLFRLGSYHWFFRDDFSFITERQLSSPADLFRPHNSHWTTIPIIAFGVLWKLFGLRSYVPYQATLLALHLSAAVLLRVIMRRAGVGPWLATAFAGVFVLFGPGSENIVWAFQISFTGSLVFGLTQLVLADHDGPVDRRDWLALGSGLLGLMCSGVGLTLVGVVGLATLARRGWRIALMQTAPLGAVYLLYSVTEHPQLDNLFGRPTIPVAWRWVVNSQIGTFEGLGHYTVLSVALAVLLVVGLAFALVPNRGAELRGRLAVPAAMLLGSVAFAFITAQGRWFYGPEGARSSRYVYLGAALVLPALSVAGQALSQRWRAVGPMIVVALLVPIVANAGQFEIPPFGSSYFDNQERVLTTAVRMPFAKDVPPNVRPIPDVYLPQGLDIGFLLDAEANGRLEPRRGEISSREENEFRIRLGVSESDGSLLGRTCEGFEGPTDISPAKGSVLGISNPVRISTLDGSEPSSPPISFSPAANGQLLTIELDDLHLRVEPGPGRTSFVICR